VDGKSAIHAVADKVQLRVALIDRGSGNVVLFLRKYRALFPDM